MFFTVRSFTRSYSTGDIRATDRDGVGNQAGPSALRPAVSGRHASLRSILLPARSPEVLTLVSGDEQHAGGRGQRRRRSIHWEDDAELARGRGRARPAEGGPGSAAESVRYVDEEAGSSCDDSGSGRTGSSYTDEWTSGEDSS